MPTILELGQKVKAKHPEYRDMADIDVGKKIKAKYPTEYADFSDAPAPVKPKTGLMEKAGNALNTIFPAKNIGDVIGTGIAKLTARPEDRQYIKTETTPLKVLGDVAQNALYFTPAGAVEGLVEKGAAKVLPKLAAKAIPTASKIATGAGIGYGSDVSRNLSEGKTGGAALKPGVGTLVGGAIPAIAPVTKGLARLGGETLGATTGTGYGAIKTGLQSARAGGETAEAFTDALRGKTSPENIVEQAKTGLGDIIKNRTNKYTEQLTKLKTNKKIFDHKPILESFSKKLDEFDVFANPDGTLNFSRSPGLGRYEKDLQQISQTLAEWGKRPGDNTVVGIDKLKQVLDDFRIGSSDSKKFDSFVSTLRNDAQKLIKNEPGYDKLVKDYAESTGLIKDIQKGLSLGDKASTDTAFRKLSTTLRTNNEFRKQLVDELNKSTGGLLLPKIAGQQLSEFLPRGIVGKGIAASGGIFGIIPLIKTALLTSPRVAGELINALGFTGNKASELIKFIQQKGGKLAFPGDMLLGKLKK